VAGGTKQGVARRATLALIAAQAGVDTSTVSRVLRNDDRTRVSAETRRRVEAIASGLGYVPNANARSLRFSQTMTIGLLVPNITGFVYRDVIRGAEAAARESDYVLVVIDGSDLGKANDAFHRLVLEGRVDGLLIASGVVTDSLADSVVATSARCIILNRRIGGRYASVIEDDEAGMQLGVEELIRIGHRKIACLAGPKDTDTARRRLLGYRAAMKNAALPVGRGAVVHTSFEEAGGFEGMQQLLASPNRPTAVAVVSLASAIGALAACHRAGVRVPDDISIIAFHDAPIAEFANPSLSTIAMPLFELGYESMVLLLRLLNGDSVPTLTRVTEPKPRLMLRDSIAAPAATDVASH
jgi:LacI family transcriptional regulator